jgi:hypothetical protein
MIETKVETLDPCSQCGAGTTCCRPSGLCCAAGTTCRDGACVRVEGCNPPCDRDEACEAGRCVSACDPPCRRPKRCDADLRRCVGGEAPPPRDAPPPRKRGCSPACRDGQTCNEATGECEGGEVISGSVLSVTEEGGGSIVLINRGSQDGVRRGASGTVGSFAFTVKEVFATRCRAKVNAKPEQLKNASKVRISK